MGGIRFEHLNSLTRSLWSWCEEKNIWVFASYIKSSENVEADRESRRIIGETEYTLSQEAFKIILHSLGRPEIYLFASRLNAKCKNYVSWFRDPDSIAVDAFTLSWKKYFFMLFRHSLLY